MLRKPPYFKKAEPDAPEPLACTIYRTSRFEEIDPMNVMWHGRYPSYLEDARVAFGEQYGLGYAEFFREKVAAPIKHMYIDYHAPIGFGETVAVTVRLHYTEAARLNFEYALHSQEGALLTTAYTVQLFWLAETGEMCFGQPEFYEQFCKRWKEGAMP